MTATTARKATRPSHWSGVNPHHARRDRPPDAADPVIEQRLTEVIGPAVYAQVAAFHRRGLRERILTLPLMLALLLAMVWRHVPSVQDLLRLLVREKLLWAVPPARVPSQQALDARLRTLPADLLEPVLWDVVGRMRARFAARTRPLSPSVVRAQAQFAAVQVFDASTLDALFRKVGLLRGASPTPLGGQMAAVIDLPSRLPAALWVDPDPTANEKTFCDRVVRFLTAGSLSICDLGFFAFPFFDQFTDATAFFLTRLREKTSYSVVQVLAAGPHLHDQIIHLGRYRSARCHHPVRLIEAEYNGKWYRYLTNVLDPACLSAEDVVDLYRRRWRIEEAFLVVKSLLDLSYLWIGAFNGVLLQLWATWLLYSALLDLCDQIADRLGLCPERISLEMVYRGLYHFSVAFRNGTATDPVAYFCDPANADLDVVKRERKRRQFHKELPLDKSLSPLNL